MQSKTLIAAVQSLSLARTVDDVARVVRTTARALTGADGASFVLRDGDQCYYADEDAIAPLWKGLRFPLETCISGWVMLNRRHTVIPDITRDARIPQDAYRPTFVKSLTMVPIRASLEAGPPIGAIGTYWATQRVPDDDEVELLQALADSTSIALENVQIYAELERRVDDRTAALRAAVRELELFSYSVSHDLRTPLRAIDGFSQALLEDFEEALGPSGRDYLGRIRAAAGRMDQLIDALLDLGRVTRSDLSRGPVDISALARDVAAGVTAADPSATEVVIADGLSAEADARLVRSVLENLVGNAWKFTRKVARPRIEVGTQGGVLFVRDNGAGFDMGHADRLFTPFQRLHSANDFPGSGVGLATVKRIIEKHSGRIWAESAAGAGATFYFTLEAEP